MKCSNCDHIFKRGEDFCPKCGAKKEITNYEIENDITELKFPEGNNRLSNFLDKLINNKPDVTRLIIGIPAVIIALLIVFLLAKNSGIMTPKASQSNGQVSGKTDTTNIVQDENTNPTQPGKSDNNVQTNTNEYIFPNSDKAYLTDKDLTSLSSDKLALGRNEIYARHGYVFSSEPFKSYFKSLSWYTPAPSFKGDSSSFNKYELFNIQFIKKYEDKINIKVTSSTQAQQILEKNVKLGKNEKFVYQNNKDFGENYYEFDKVYILDDGSEEAGDIGSLIFVEKHTGDIYVLDLDKDPNGKTMKKYKA